MKNRPTIFVDRVKVRRQEKTGLYVVIFETGDIIHEYVLLRELAESLIKNLNRL